MKRTFLAIFVMLIAVTSYAQQKIIKLKSVQLNYKPKHYYIANVIDERADTTSLGTMRAGLMNKVVEINLANGAGRGLYEFIQSKVKPDMQLTPVTMHIKELQIIESANFATERADLNSNMQFSVNGDRVAELTYSGYAAGGFDVSASIGKLIGQMVEHNLKSVDDYLLQNEVGVKQSSLPPEITVEILRTGTGSQLAYSRTRPLVRSDFAGEVDDLSRASAATGSGIYSQYSFQKKGNVTKYKITLLPYFDQSKSWWADKNVNNEKKILAHEQLHFDITAYFTCVLADRLKAADFGNNPETVFQEIVHACEAERDAMQNQYDKETRHGIIAAKQAEWTMKVHGLLTTVTCL